MFAAEIFDDISQRQVSALKDTLSQKGFLHLNVQERDAQAFIAFLERFGAITFTQGEQSSREHSLLNKVTNKNRTRKPRSVWHTDTSYVEKPPAYTALMAIDVPDAGGETLIADQFKAFETLPDLLRLIIGDARTIKHSSSGIDIELSHYHPIFRRHPISGKTAIYMSTPERCSVVEGKSEADSQQVIKALFAHCTHDRFVYRHKWREGDVLLWDNRCTLHKADHSSVIGDRTFLRGMVAGEAPICARSSNTIDTV